MAEFVQYRTFGDRRIEIVKGKTFSANQTWLAACSHHHHRPPPLPCGDGGGRLPPSVGEKAGKRRKKGGSSLMKSWAFNDPEMKRRRRVASYKVYAIKGKVKASLRKGIRWIKSKCSKLIRGL
ncbi:hypothetical protein EJ110_NYTH05001 [Nymphaea thermarum]|nr:hypothetical protein EJ110_NYTH05001 [Nymphaea thermarum]